MIHCKERGRKVEWRDGEDGSGLSPAFGTLEVGSPGVANVYFLTFSQRAYIYAVSFTVMLSVYVTKITQQNKPAKQATTNTYISHTKQQCLINRLLSLFTIFSTDRQTVLNRCFKLINFQQTLFVSNFEPFWYLS
jgi:hypothetical protein